MEREYPERWEMWEFLMGLNYSEVAGELPGASNQPSAEVTLQELGIKNQKAAA